MPQARYILRVSDGSLWPWNEDWLKVDGMIEYLPEVHGYRREVAAQMGLVEPTASTGPAPVRQDRTAPAHAGGVEAPQVLVFPAVDVSEHVAGQAISTSTVVTERKAQGQSPEPDLSDVFAPQ